jgi:ATP-dependent Clp protease adapter protein ClpS
MNVEELKKMSKYDQLNYVMLNDNGDAFREHLDIESFKGSDWALWINVNNALIKHCPFEKLSRKDWAFVIAELPELVSKFLDYGKWEDFDGSDWVILLEQPELRKYCDWSKLKFAEWKMIFSYIYDLDEKCPFADFKPEEIDDLLRLYPELTPYTGLKNPYQLYIVNNHPITATADDDEIPFGPIPEDKSAESHELSCLLQEVIGFSKSESYRITAGIRRNRKSVVAVYAGDLAQHKFEQLSAALRSIKLPLTCGSEPFNEESL